MIQETRKQFLKTMGLAAVSGFAMLTANISGQQAVGQAGRAFSLRIAR